MQNPTTRQQTTNNPTQRMALVARDLRRLLRNAETAPVEPGYRQGLQMALDLIDHYKR